ncbi:MAG: hypothetical protein COV52_07260 [Gammaproteobacteria bacterium CG11_big_fil_rev_8_21_14_0_20_46_22]|nr:MAG: hypothetical protein COW05_00275 [Gammaproteobacteria bacterium CG12_big_fil_rev_8_21_14_0_65_46_12]PIR10832.1 MAG: hypothetical protein COV52_07260 [Gammaproteobacteria bacterium CG11_big_fil_rev_8_21_14_0_20_46_22]
MTKHRGTGKKRRQIDANKAEQRYKALTADQDRLVQEKRREQLGQRALALRSQAPPPAATGVQANTESPFELHRTIEHLKKRLDDSRATQTREADEHLVRSNRQLSEISALKRELTAKNQRISTLEAQLAQVERNLNSANESNAQAAQAQTEQAQSTIEKLEQGLTELRAENSQALHKIRRLEQAYSLSQHEHKEATAALQQTHATELAITAAQNQAWILQVVTLQSQHTSLKRRFSEQKKLLNNAHPTHHELHKTKPNNSASPADRPPPANSNSENYDGLILTLIQQVDELTKSKKNEQQKNEELKRRLSTLEARLALYETTPPPEFSPFTGMCFFNERRGSLASDRSDTPDAQNHTTGSPIGSRPSPSSTGSD